MIKEQTGTRNGKEGAYDRLPVNLKTYGEGKDTYWRYFISQSASKMYKMREQEGRSERSREREKRERDALETRKKRTVEAVNQIEFVRPSNAEIQRRLTMK